MSETIDPTTNEATINPDEWRTITPADLAACEGRRLEVLMAAAIGLEPFRAANGQWVYITKNLPEKYEGAFSHVPNYLKPFTTLTWHLCWNGNARFGEGWKPATPDPYTDNAHLLRAYIAAAQKEAAHDA